MRLLLIMLTTFLASQAFAGKDWRETGTSKAAVEGGACVRETPWMRRNHMDLIKHDRDITVHQGVRTVDGSLSQCIRCHANKDGQGHFVAVDSPGQFCAACHQFTGVTMDCFTCHSPVARQ